MNIEKSIDLCNMIASDTEEDAKNFDGKPFNGRTVAEYLGNHGTAIAALSTILKELLQDLKEVQ